MIGLSLYLLFLVGIVGVAYLARRRWRPELLELYRSVRKFLFTYFGFFGVYIGYLLVLMLGLLAVPLDLAVGVSDGFGWTLRTELKEYLWALAGALLLAAVAHEAVNLANYVEHKERGPWGDKWCERLKLYPEEWERDGSVDDLKDALRETLAEYRYTHAGTTDDLVRDAVSSLGKETL